MVLTFENSDYECVLAVSHWWSGKLKSKNL